MRTGTRREKLKSTPGLRLLTWAITHESLIESGISFALDYHPAAANLLPKISNLDSIIWSIPSASTGLYLKTQGRVGSNFLSNWLLERPLAPRSIWQKFHKRYHLIDRISTICTPNLYQQKKRYMTKYHQIEPLLTNQKYAALDERANIDRSLAIIHSLAQETTFPNVA